MSFASRVATEQRRAKTSRRARFTRPWTSTTFYNALENRAREIDSTHRKKNSRRWSSKDSGRHFSRREDRTILARRQCGNFETLRSVRKKFFEFQRIAKQFFLWGRLNRSRSKTIWKFRNFARRTNEIFDGGDRKIFEEIFPVEKIEFAIEDHANISKPSKFAKASRAHLIFHLFQNLGERSWNRLKALCAKEIFNDYQRQYGNFVYEPYETNFWRMILERSQVNFTTVENETIYLRRYCLNFESFKMCNCFHDHGLRRIVESLDRVVCMSDNSWVGGRWIEEGVGFWGLVENVALFAKGWISEC